MMRSISFDNVVPAGPSGLVDIAARPEPLEDDYSFTPVRPIDDAVVADTIAPSVRTLERLNVLVSAGGFGTLIGGLGLDVINWPRGAEI